MPKYLLKKKDSPWTVVEYSPHSRPLCMIYFLMTTYYADGAHLQISWNETEHEGIVSLDFLRENSYSRESLESSASLRDPTYFKVN